MLNIRKLVKNYRETGALAEQCGVFSFINDWCFITKNGAIGAVIEVEGIDYECLDQRTLDTTTKRLEAAFRLCGPEFRVYQYLFKSHFHPDQTPAYSNPVVQRAEVERSRYFAEKSEEMFSIRIYYVLLYQSASHAAKMTPTKAVGSFFSHGLTAGSRNLKSLFSARKEILLIEEEIEQATTVLLRQANSLVSFLSDLVEIKVVNKKDAFGMLLMIFNVDPEKQAQRLKFDVMTDKYLVNSPLESHTDHLTIDGYHTRVLTLREEPSESRPIVLQQLLRIPATYHIVTEWRAVEASEAVHYIESMRTHFHKTKSSLSVSSDGDRLKDETKVEFVDDLNECLKEVQKRGNYFGKFSLTVVIYDRNRARVEKAVSDFGKAFATVGASLYSETYNQLSAFFATCPGNSHFNFRQLYITNNNYADWSFLFTLHEGHRWNTFLNREALALVETTDGTPFYLNLHQRIQDGNGSTSDDVAHTFLTGRTGSGKSFFANFLTLALQKYDPRTFIFDLGGSYEKLIHVSDWLVNNTPELRFDVAGLATPCSTGLQLGSRYIADPEKDMVFDYLPEPLMLEKTHNLQDLARVLVLDKWAGNADGRQVVFTKPATAPKYSATFIDQGYCFNAGEWNFPDSPLRGTYARNSVYQQVMGWESFEPVLSRAEQMDSAELWRLTEGLPEEWWSRYGSADDLTHLIETLHQRCLSIRNLIAAFRNSCRNPFPNWKA